MFFVIIKQRPYEDYIHQDLSSNEEAVYTCCRAKMKVAILSSIAWRTPPRKYGPWEQVASNIAEGLVAKGIDVTLFATADSKTKGKLESTCVKGYEEDRSLDPKVQECMHISYLMEKADQFDLIHNNFDFLPLTYSRLIKTPMITTIHGFSSEKIIDVYERYNDINQFVSISYSDRSHRLRYIANIYNGINPSDFTFNANPEDYLLYFGRIHYDKGAYEAIQIAKKAHKKLIISGLIQDQEYFDKRVKPYLNKNIKYVGNSGPKVRDILLGGALALLHPINFDEPFGLSVAEAMMCGTPVIAFNRGSMPELIIDQETGFLVKNVDEAVNAVANISHVNRKDCYRWSKDNFSNERMVNDYIRLYKNLLNGFPKIKDEPKIEDLIK